MSEIATWSDAEFSFQIDYARDALEKIRERAMQGLMELPKIGLGVGGVLLGEREANRITILDSFEIPCSHALGPAFSLTPEEQAHARGLIANSEPSRVIGWYCSKGVRTLELADSDRTMLGALFPASQLLGMLVQPHMVRPARVLFLWLDASAEMRKGRQGELTEWRAEPAAPPVIEPVPARFAPAKPVPAKPEPAKREPAKPEPAKPDPVKVTAPIGNVAGPFRRDDSIAEAIIGAAQRRDSGWKWLGWAVAAVLASVIAAGLLLKWDWAFPPPLVLRSTDSDGTLVIHWNSEAVKGAADAEILIKDGDLLRAVPLDRSQLSTGEFRYLRKSARVTATLTAGSAQAETTFPAPNTGAASPER